MRVAPSVRTNNASKWPASALTWIDGPRLAVSARTSRSKSSSAQYRSDRYCSSASIFETLRRHELRDCSTSRFGLFEIGEVTAVGQHHQARPGYRAGDVIHHISRDEVVVAPNQQRWDIEPA